MACKFCFPPETLVATSQGLQPIGRLFDACTERVDYGAGKIAFPRELEVWTRTGGRSRVTKVFGRPYRGEMLTVKAMAAPPLRLTPNHQVFVAHRDHPDRLFKIPAAELSADHYLVIPKRRSGSSADLDVLKVLAEVEPGFHAPRTRRVALDSLQVAFAGQATSAEIAAELGYHPAYVRRLRGQWQRGELTEMAPRPIRTRVENGWVRFLGERGRGVPVTIPWTPEFAWLLGFYCAEGHVGVHPQRPNSRYLVFSTGHHEAHLAERTAQLLAKYFDVRPRIRRRRTTLTVECTSTSVAHLFVALCGRGAKGKQVPPPLIQTSEPVIRGFLEGYLAGDGYEAETHLVATTVSSLLAYGLYELGLHLNLLPTFFVHHPAPRKRIEGREVAQATTYIVKFKRDRFHCADRRCERAPWRDAGDHFLVPLQRIEREAYDGWVYNLEVDDADHAYLAPFIAVSNCQNWDISKAREFDILTVEAPPNAVARAARELECRSVAYTYNDPVIFHEYVIDTAKACREYGIKNVAVTAGYVTEEPRREFYQYMDAANVDLKAFTEDFYRKICGGHLQPVLDTLEYIKHETDCWLEITTLLIPGENDSTEEIDKMTRWVVEKLGPDVPHHFTAFHPDWKMMDHPPTPPETLLRARKIAMENGLRYVYTGNIHYPEGDSTWCHHCGQLLIGRDWYVLTDWNLTPDGRCCQCGTPVPGVFEPKPGNWGARRYVVDMARFVG
ncbi:AmmeMemoRadiSam system radical SAM enzyme [Methylomarinovum tepidoasis]|uniref:AmmeMemoRadiSam system radical SAM enzyme n=1 Tax=Methylomarinovum tepidoasis TaxID=2840183 RepID=UPI003075D235